MLPLVTIAQMVSQSVSERTSAWMIVWAVAGILSLYLLKDFRATRRTLNEVRDLALKLEIAVNGDKNATVPGGLLYEHRRTREDNHQISEAVQELREKFTEHLRGEGDWQVQITRHNNRLHELLNDIKDELHDGNGHHDLGR